MSSGKTTISNGEIMAGRSTARGYVLVVLLCLSLNLVIACLILVYQPRYFVDQTLITDSDARHYLLLGTNMMEHGSFSRCREAPFRPDLFRTPMYPLFVGVLDYAGGLAAIYLFQVLLHAGSCACVMLLAHRTLGNRAALWAGILFAVDPVLAVYNFMPMSESLALFFLTAAAALAIPVIVSLEKVQPAWRYRMLGSGFLLGLCILTRPAALCVPLILSLACLAIGFVRRCRLHSLIACGMLLLPVIALTGTWVARNALVFSVPKLTSNDSSLLVYFTAAGAYELRYGLSLKEAQAKIANEFGIATYGQAANAHTVNRSEAEIERELQAVRWKVLSKYPGHLALASMLAVIKASISHPTDQLATMLGREWVAPHVSNLLRSPGVAIRRLWENDAALVLVFIGQLAQVAIELGCAMVGIFVAVKNRQSRATALILVLLLSYFYLTVVMEGLEADCRFRIPALPFLSIFAGCGISAMLLKFGGRRTTSRVDVCLA